MKKIYLTLLAILLFQVSIYAQLKSYDNEGTNGFITKEHIDVFNVNLDSLMLDSIIVAYKNTNSIPGIASLIFKDGKIIWNKNYGYRNRELQLPVEDSTFFMIGSISKTFVATSIMQLWEHGMINLDDNINNYLPAGLKVANPYFPEDTITVRMLMIHTSSIRQNWNVITPLITCGDSPIRLDSFLVRYFTPGREYYRTANFHNYRPGTQWDYTNVSYDLLALMVENLTGKSFDEYSRDSILTPLSMYSSSWFLEEMDLNQIAIPYEGSSPVCHQGAPDYPMGFLRSNKIDMLNYLRTYLNYGKFNDYRILDSTTIAYMLSDQLGYPAVMELPWFTYTQGLSWWQVFPFNNSAWSRGGSWNGYLAYISFDPNEKWGTIWFQNQRPGNSIVGKIGEINAPFSTYAHLCGNIYAFKPTVINPYAEINKDSVLFQTTFSDIYNYPFTPHLIYTNSDSSQTDSLTLFDDGIHGDLLSNDGIYGAYIPPQPEEDFYTIGVSTINNQTNKYFITPKIAGFTNAGPVVLDSINIKPKSTYFSVIPFLENKSISKVITNASVKLTSNDPWFAGVAPSFRALPDINPGSVAQPSSSFSVGIIDTLSPGYVIFKVEVLSDGWTYWTDTMQVPIPKPPDEVDNEEIHPIAFNLEQNYPNPFNPSTTIGYQLAEGCKVTLKIYDVLGKIVETLVDEYKPAGRYETGFSAAKLPSGVYFYQLRTGSYVETKKMLLLK